MIGGEKAAESAAWMVQREGLLGRQRGQGLGSLSGELGSLARGRGRRETLGCSALRMKRNGQIRSVVGQC